MTVWLVGRRSARRRFGGDQLQIEESAGFGRSMGYDVRVVARADSVRPAAGDCVHLFNIQRSLDWGDLPERSVSEGARLLISPLFHPLGRYHAEGRYGLGRLAAKWVSDADRFAALRWRGRDSVARAVEVLTLADRVLLSHDREADGILQWLGHPVTESRQCVVPVAVPSGGGGAALAEVPKGDFVLCAGRVEPLKNSALVGRVCAELGLPLVFAGPGPGPRHPGYVRQALHGATWLGALSYEDLRQVMGAARVHVLASWTEVVGRVTLEAALGGAAVVLSDVGFAPDYLGRGSEGVFLFEPGDEVGLSTAVSAAWARGRDADSALVDRVQKHYTWEAVGPRLIEAWSA